MIACSPLKPTWHTALHLIPSPVCFAWVWPVAESTRGLVFYVAKVVRSQPTDMQIWPKKKKQEEQAVGHFAVGTRGQIKRRRGDKKKKQGNALQQRSNKQF